MNRAAERPDDGRKTVLIVEDDPGTQRVLASGLATSLGMFDVLTANHGQEAVELLESRPVDVVVTDLAMPVMDGFALIGYITNRANTLPVVVLSALAPTTVAEGLDGYGGLTVLRKPAGYPEVARAVLEALERHDLGQVAGIPLASILQLVEAERRTCSLGVTSGRRRGRLHFESGRLINAFSDDFGAEGEAAAYDILTWSRTAIEFGRLPEGVRRTIDMPTQTLLIEVARRQDAQREREAKLTPPAPVPRAANGAIGTSPEPDPSPESGAAHDAAPDAGAAPDPVDAEDRPTHEAAAATSFARPEERAGERAEDREHERPNAEPTRDAPDVAAALASPSLPPLVPSLDVDEAVPPAAAPATPPVEATVADRAAVAPAEPSSAPPDAPAPSAEAARAAPAAARSPAPHADLVAAIERLTHRVQAADAALAAVADEVDAFRAAQQRYDDAVRLQEERRRAVETARRDVADLARQILQRMDGLFDAFGGDAPDRTSEAHPTSSPSNA
jgi:CheY-like chemotaxis protein